MAWMHLVRGAALAAIVVFTTAAGAAAQCADSIDLPGSTATLMGESSESFYWPRLDYLFGLPTVRLQRGSISIGHYQLENGSMISVRCAISLF